MNIVINQLDNLIICDKTYEFVLQEYKKLLNFDGAIIGVNGEYMIGKHDVRPLIEISMLKTNIGVNAYDALMRKPKMIFLTPTMEDEFEADKQTLDDRYGLKMITFNNFAQAFALGCWFIKDSCVSANKMYWENCFNTYNMQARRDADATLSDGSIDAVHLTDAEVQEAITRMFEVLCYLLPDQSQMAPIERGVSVGTQVWEIDKSISTEGNSFANALTKLQEARRTGFIATKIDRYCSMLECLYAINKMHKKSVARITAAYIGKDETERSEIVRYMEEAYGVRSDSSHGDNLKYLAAHDSLSLKKLSTIVDDYVRRVFRKALANESLNYGSTANDKSNTRAYFRNLALSLYPELQ